MKRAIGIVRVSQTRGREGESFHSPKTQRQRIEDACKQAGLELTDCFEELDVSGTKPLSKRPGLNRAIQAVEEGTADVVVVAYFDRLVRSVRVQAEIAERVERAGGDVLTLDAGQITNGKAATKLQANILGAIAQYVADQTREKVGEAQARAVAQGVAPWKNVPAGFVRGPDKRYVPDPKTAPVIREAFERRARGESINSIRHYLADHGIQRTYGGVVELLTLTAYVGEIRFGELVNPEAHAPIVDRELFDRVQKTRTPRDDPRAPSDRLLARLGVLRCAHCDARLVVAVNGYGKAFYRCPPNSDCRHATISAPMVEELVLDAVRELAHDLVGRASLDCEVAQAKAALDEAQAALDRAVRLLAATSLTSEASAAETLNAVAARRDEAQRAYDEATAADGAAQLAVTADTVLDHGSLTGKRELIKAVIERVEVAKGRGPERVNIIRRVEP